MQATNEKEDPRTIQSLETVCNRLAALLQEMHASPALLLVNELISLLEKDASREVADRMRVRRTPRLAKTPCTKLPVPNRWALRPSYCQVVFGENEPTCTKQQFEAEIAQMIQVRGD